MIMRRDLVLITTKAKAEDKEPKYNPIITAESTTDSGVIVSKGKDVDKELKVGQRVYFLDDYKKVSIKNETFLVMEESNIFAVE